MRKVVSVLLTISLLISLMVSVNAAGARVPIDFGSMSDEDLLDLAEELSAVLAEHGYSYGIKDAESGAESREQPAETSEEKIAENTTDNASVTMDESAKELSDALENQPIIINYAKVGNYKGLRAYKDTSVSMINNTEKEVKYLYVIADCYNRVGDFCGQSTLKLTGPFEAFSEMRGISSDSWKDNTADSLTIISIRIIYMDGSELVIDDKEEIEELYE